MKNLLSSLLLASVLASAARAGTLPEGSWSGSSALTHGPDVMALLVRKDPANPTAGYAILAEYTRLPFIPGPERLEIARWVPRLYVYRVEQIGKLRFALKPLRVSAAGELELDGGYPAAGELTLAEKGTGRGATLTRYEKGSAVPAEVATFDGKVSSTWEEYVPGNYFRSKDSTGGDYLKKDINTRLGKDKVADFFQLDFSGTFDVVEKGPGLYVLAPKGPVKGVNQAAGRIAVFVDIVNWKPFFTTDELLLINPDDARDVGFYYERH
jgi:hypothetical protein